MLKKRVLTAITLFPLAVLAVLYLPSVYFALLTALIILIAAWEWTYLMQIKSTPVRVLYLLGVIWVGFAVFLVPISLVFIIAFIWWVLVFIFVLLYPSGTRWWYGHQIQRALAGFFVLVPCWASINYLHGITNGTYKLLFLLFLVWGADASAYFVGKKWGRAKLAPHISPGKTWIGLLGALVFSVFFTLFAIWILQLSWIFWQAGLEITCTTVIFSVIGDLFESMMKRQAGVKDSSHLLPGHGGMLDRIDSLTAAAPTFTLLSMLLGRFAQSIF